MGILETVFLVAAAIVGALVSAPFWKRAGRKDAKTKSKADSLDRVLDGQEAVKNRPDDPNEAVEGNDAKWN